MNISDLAKRAVACVGLRWMIPGVSTVEGARCVAAADTEGRQLWAFKDGETRIGNVLSLPDLDDPGTLGCFEHELLPAAGFTDAHLDASQGPDGGSLWWVIYRPDPVSFPNKWFSAVDDGASSKQEALVAALEAAP